MTRRDLLAMTAILLVAGCARTYRWVGRAHERHLERDDRGCRGDHGSPFTPAVGDERIYVLCMRALGWELVPTGNVP